jgi:hypothetical protein
VDSVDFARIGDGAAALFFLAALWKMARLQTALEQRAHCASSSRRTLRKPDSHAQLGITDGPFTPRGLLDPDDPMAGSRQAAMPPTNTRGMA